MFEPSVTSHSAQSGRFASESSGGTAGRRTWKTSCSSSAAPPTFGLVNIRM